MTSARDQVHLRAPAGLVRFDDARVDWSRWYLTDEADMGDGFEQGEIIRLLLSCLEMLAEERGWADRIVAAGRELVPTQPEARAAEADARARAEARVAELEAKLREG